MIFICSVIYIQHEMAGLMSSIVSGSLGPIASKGIDAATSLYKSSKSKGNSRRHGYRRRSTRKPKVVIRKYGGRRRSRRKSRKSRKSRRKSRLSLLSGGRRRRRSTKRSRKSRKSRRSRKSRSFLI